MRSPARARRTTSLDACLTAQVLTRDCGEIVMATAFGFDIMHPQGVVFALNEPAKKDRVQTFGGWEAALRQDADHVGVRGGTLDPDKPLSTVAAAAHPVAEDFLDIVAVEERTPLLVAEPHDNLVWRTGPHGLKVQLTAGITFAAEPLDITATVRDAAGNIVPPPPYMPPPHHSAYRYFRYSQAARNVFDAYRNMFLALEALLDHIAPKQRAEGETDWLQRALRDAVQKHAADLAPFVQMPGKDPVEAFAAAHYSAIRCAVFHAKSGTGQALRPGTLADHDVVLHQLLAVQNIVEHLMKALFGVRLPHGGLYHSGFGDMLEMLLPVMHLLLGPAECPTVERLLAEDNKLPEGVIGPVRFEGLRPGTTDEWVFSSDIKCAELPFTRITSLRLIADVVDKSTLGSWGIFLIPIMDKLNRTLLATDIDLQGVSKLVVRIRCVLRNVQSQRRGFAS
jgi:Methylamine utilization protein MauJ